MPPVWLCLSLLEARTTPSTGSILREYWSNIPGTHIGNLTGHANYPNSPTASEEISSFETPTNFGDNYGTRVRGLLHPTVTGTYELYISGDDQCQLWLSNDADPANAVVVASVPSWTHPRQWDKFPSQKAVVKLVAGQTYFIQALHKEGLQGDHLAVGWKTPNSGSIQVIPGTNLSPARPTVRLFVDRTRVSEWGSEAGQFSVTRDTDVGRDLTVQYQVGGTAKNGVDYQLLPGSVVIPAGQRSAVISILPIDDTTPEPTETVSLTLQPDARYHLMPGVSSRSGTITVHDDDGLPEGTTSLTNTAPSSFGFASAKGATRTVISVSGQSFTQANRVVTFAAPTNVWDIRLHTQNLAPVSAGDTLRATFWLRNATAGGAPASVRFIYERASAPWTKSAEQTLTAVSPSWQRFDVAFKAAESYNGSTSKAQLYFGLGYADQTVEIGGVSLVNYGPTVNPNDLNVTAQVYQGQAGGDLAWRDQAEARIDEHRKATLNVKVVDVNGLPVEGAVVRSKLTRHGFSFGTAVAANFITNTHPVNGPNYRNIITQYFNAAVLENDLKWPEWMANPTRAINAVNWLLNHGIAHVRGHTLIWPGWQYIPASPGNTYGGINYRSDPNMPDSQEEYNARVTVDGPAVAAAWLRQRVLAHIAEEAGHPQLVGKLRDWDVVNEPYSNHNVQDVLVAQYGNTRDFYLKEWFDAAKAADPNARLFLNDYPSLAGGAHLTSYFNTIQYLRTIQTPLEGYGFQAHFGSGTPGMNVMLNHLNMFADAFPDLPIQITEFDQESLDLQLQANFLRDFTTLTFSHPKIDAFMMWGFWEGRHWRPDAALWRNNWTIKPNGQQFLDLWHHDWQTDVTGTTRANGVSPARGFLGNYQVTVTYGGQTVTVPAVLPAGGSAVTVALPIALPTVSNVRIDDGTQQRSNVRSVVVTFNQAVALESAAFTLTRVGGPAVAYSLSTALVNGVTAATLTFPALADGNYELRVIATKVRAVGQPTVTMPADFVTTFHRLFGDADGNRAVNFDDFLAFRLALGGSSMVFDADDDAAVTFLDFLQFRARFGLSI